MLKATIRSISNLILFFLWNMKVLILFITKKKNKKVENNDKYK